MATRPQAQRATTTPSSTLSSVLFSALSRALSSALLSALPVLSALLLALGAALQVYLRVYPYLKPECQWPEGAAHRIVAFGDPQITGYLHLQKWRKRLDILGNDRFLSQVAESVRAATQPEYVAVLGDLLSSQWIATDEFDARADRFAQIFPAAAPGALVNVTGNHDIGYHGEITEERVERFERRFGALNFVAAETPELRLVVLNSLSLDGPPFDDAWHTATRDFLQSLRGYEGATVLLTHIPLYKPLGVCRDGPRFDFYPEEQGGGLKQQNHLSQNASELVLECVFGASKNPGGGVVLTGHDHEGCLSSYAREPGSDVWQIRAGFDSGAVHEATVRSVMGEFGGNAGLLSAAPAPNGGLEWTFSLCRFHVQHVWWATQVVTILGVASLPAALAA